MLQSFFEKMVESASHHQVVVLVIAGLSFICITWSIEKILEHFIVIEGRFSHYFILLGIGLALLWFAQHYVLRVI